MNDPRDYQIDLTSTLSEPLPVSQMRPYVSVRFECCNVHQKVYRYSDGKHFRGRCPKCGVPVNFAVVEAALPPAHWWYEDRLPENA